jgi:two-component system response regulator GlrR
MSAEKILIVDDDRNLLEVLKMRLESLHYDVTAVLKEGEAKKAMAGEPFDLAIVDLQLAEKDGISLGGVPYESEMPLLFSPPTASRAVEAMKRGTPILQSL